VKADLCLHHQGRTAEHHALTAASSLNSIGGVRPGAYSHKVTATGGPPASVQAVMTGQIGYRLVRPAVGYRRDRRRKIRIVSARQRYSSLKGQ
jgi:hypothetical protein